MNTKNKPPAAGEAAPRIRSYQIDMEARGGVIDHHAREFTADGTLVREKRFATKEYAESQIRMWKLENADHNKVSAGEATHTPTLANWLGLPAGFTAWLYRFGIECVGPQQDAFSPHYRKTYFIPSPYDARPQSWWQDQARAALNSAKIVQSS